MRDGETEGKSKGSGEGEEPDSGGKRERKAAVVSSK